MNTLNPGEPFEKLPETYVIFITRNDILGYNRPICHINRKVEEENETFEDREHIIYVNSKKQEDTELGKRMHDLHCKNAKDIYSDILSSRVYELKETEKGVKEMCKDMEEIYNEGRENGFEAGEQKKAKETVLALAEMKMPIEQIAQAVKVTTEVVQSWIGEGMVTTQ